MIAGSRVVSIAARSKDFSADWVRPKAIVWAVVDDNHFTLLDAPAARLSSKPDKMEAPL
ncbi:hypothetical protein ACLJYM_21340 [Rhizobium giardinii]|uniref:hypothetical protein n=1 Tax=Rhizobium giardinii TaxID=56731 RepID=UPI0039E16C6C